MTLLSWILLLFMVGFWYICKSTNYQAAKKSVRNDHRRQLSIERDTYNRSKQLKIKGTPDTFEEYMENRWGKNWKNERMFGACDDTDKAMGEDLCSRIRDRFLDPR